MALAVLACAAALMLGACDSSTTEPTDERFGIAVVAETPGGEPVVGLRVAIRPCIDVNLTGGQGDPCVADAPTAPTQPAAIAKTSGVTYQGFEVETSGLLLEALLFEMPEGVEGDTVEIDGAFVRERLHDIVEDRDLSQYIL